MASYNTVITNEGAALLASVIANQGTLTFSEMRFSTTDYDGVEQTLTVGTFGGVFITAATSGSVVDATTIKVAAQFDNSGIVGDHPLYSIGIVGTDGNTTALIAVCTTTNPDIIRAALTGVSTYAFNVNLAVSSTSNITVVGTTAAVLYDVDVVDTLISTDTDKPLSANMGKKLADEKQDKTLATPITVDGTQETTVEGALGALNTYSDKIKDNLTGRNLLDNPWFTINQRGATTITSDYGADRWMFVEGTSATYNPNGVSLDNSFICQIFENQLPNGQYTASVKYQDGTIEHGTAIKADNSTVITFFTSSTGFKLTYTPLAKRFDVNGKNGSTTSIRAVKLELGSVSTLHLDVAPDYTTELLKCQRYFYRMTQSVVTAQMALVMGFDGTNTYGLIKTPVPMASSLPTLSFTGTFDLSDVTNTYPVTSMSLTAYGGDTGTLFAQAIGGGITVSKMYVLLCGSSNAYIDISADL